MADFRSIGDSFALTTAFMSQTMRSMRTGSPHDGVSAGPRYVKPELVDYGDLIALTASTGSAGTEDGIGKTIVGGVAGVGGVSVGVGP